MDKNKILYFYLLYFLFIYFTLCITGSINRVIGGRNGVIDVINPSITPFRYTLTNKFAALKKMLIQKFHKTIFVRIRYRNIFFPENNTITLYRFYLFQINYK